MSDGLQTEGAVLIAIERVKNETEGATGRDCRRSLRPQGSIKVKTAITKIPMKLSLPEVRSGGGWTTHKPFET